MLDARCKKSEVADTDRSQRPKDKRQNRGEPEAGGQGGVEAGLEVSPAFRVYSDAGSTLHLTQQHP